MSVYGDKKLKKSFVKRNNMYVADVHSVLIAFIINPGELAPLSVTRQLATGLVVLEIIFSEISKINSSKNKTFSIIN